MFQVVRKLNSAEKASFLEMLNTKENFIAISQAIQDAMDSNDPPRPKLAEWLENYFQKLIRQTENPLAARLLVEMRTRLNFSHLAEWFILWLS